MNNVNCNVSCLNQELNSNDFKKLPNQAAWRICSFLEETSLKALSCVSKHLNHACRSKGPIYLLPKELLGWNILSQVDNCAGVTLLVNRTWNALCLSISKTRWKNQTLGFIHRLQNCFDENQHLAQIEELKNLKKGLDPFCETKFYKNVCVTKPTWYFFSNLELDDVLTNIFSSLSKEKLELVQKKFIYELPRGKHFAKKLQTFFKLLHLMELKWVWNQVMQKELDAQQKHQLFCEGVATVFLYDFICANTESLQMIANRLDVIGLYYDRDVLDEVLKSLFLDHFQQQPQTIPDGTLLSLLIECIQKNCIKHECLYLLCSLLKQQDRLVDLKKMLAILKEVTFIVSNDSLISIDLRNQIEEKTQDIERLCKAE